jgi:hypothetical protein
LPELGVRTPSFTKTAIDHKSEDQCQHSEKMMGLNFFISKTKQNWNLDPTFIVLQAQHPSALPLFS